MSKKAVLLSLCMLVFLGAAVGSDSSSGNESNSRSVTPNAGASEEEKDMADYFSEKMEEYADQPEEKKEDQAKSEEKTSGPKTVAIGEEFGNDTILGVVTDVDLDYKKYNDVWVTVDEGKKAVYVKIKLTNISDSSNYVSVGDFNCYVDDVSTSPELVGGNEDYNANIDPGRSAVLGALYVVPNDAKHIELEYDPFGETADRQIIVIQDEKTEGTQISVKEDAKSNEKKEASSATSSGGTKVIGIGDEFGNDTITGVVTDANLDYKGYNEFWTTMEDDQKAIYIKIKVTNVSDSSNYVSVGDYRCYVDDVIIDADMFGGDDDYNANIDPGRSAVLGAMYIVPKDANTIELEYAPIGEASDRVIIKIQ